MITENLSTLKIHKLTQSQYERELATGNIDKNALYLTPEEDCSIPTYTESDYGKILSCTANGLAWIEQEVLPDAEGVAF